MAELLSLPVGTSILDITEEFEEQARTKELEEQARKEALRNPLLARCNLSPGSSNIIDRSTWINPCFRTCEGGDNGCPLLNSGKRKDENDPRICPGGYIAQIGDVFTFTRPHPVDIKFGTPAASKKDKIAAQSGTLSTKNLPGFEGYNSKIVARNREKYDRRAE